MKSAKRVSLALINYTLFVAAMLLVNAGLGLDSYLTENGINYRALVITCATIVLIHYCVRKVTKIPERQVDPEILSLKLKEAFASYKAVIMNVIKRLLPGVVSGGTN